MKLGILFTVGTSFFENLAKRMVVQDEEKWNRLIEESKKSEINLYEELPKYISECFSNEGTPRPPGVCALLLEILQKYKYFKVEQMENKAEEFSAELSTWVNLKTHLKELNPTEIRVLLIPTRESSYIAKNIIKPYFNAQDKEFSTAKIFVETASQELSGVGTPGFRDSLDTLTREIGRFYQKSLDRYYLVVTGGYKGFIPLVSLLGMMFPNTYLVYKHEEEEDCVIYSPLPVVPDFPHLDALRTILARERLDGEIYDALKVSFPSIESFFDPDRYERTSLGEVFYAFYKKKRTLYGKGEPILARIQNSAIREAIEEKLPYWEYLWIGDQIPETVEHSRRHALRLLEYTEHLLALFPKIAKALGEEGIAVLYSAIWLHDFGHGALFLAREPDANVFPYGCLREDHWERVSLDNGLIALDPDLVRKYHNLYTVDMLQSCFDFLLPDFEDESLRKAVLLASLYHRKKMPFFPPACEGDEGVPLEEVLKGDFKDSPGLQDKVLLASALLSFVDGLDVQTDRVVSPEYRELREARDRYEIQYHLKCIRLYQDKNWIGGREKRDLRRRLCKVFRAWIQSDLRALKQSIEDLKKWLDTATDLQEFPDLLYHIRRILFITVQKEHFLKHGLIDMVYLSYRPGDKRKQLRVHLIESEGLGVPLEQKKEILESIREDILYEYRKGEKILEKYFVLSEENIQVIRPGEASSC